MDVEEKEAIKDLFGEINYQGLHNWKGGMTQTELTMP